MCLKRNQKKGYNDIFAVFLEFFVGRKKKRNELKNNKMWYIFVTGFVENGLNTRKFGGIK